MNIDPLISAYLADQETYKSGNVIMRRAARATGFTSFLKDRSKFQKDLRGIAHHGCVEKKGAIFGEMALFGKALQARSASVIAADGNARVGVLDTRQLMAEYESLSLELRSVIKALITGLAESNGKAAALVVAANKKGHKN